MLNFRNTSIFFVGLLLLAAGLHTRFNIPVYLYIILVFLYTLLLFYGSYYVGSNFFMKVLCSAKTTSKQIAISFDDGPAEKHTAEILQVLRSKNVPAVFFCIGKHIECNETLLHQLIEEGHIIGNHSYSHHFWFDLFSTKKMLADVQAMNDTVKKHDRVTTQIIQAAIWGDHTQYEAGNGKGWVHRYRMECTQFGYDDKR